MSGAAAGTPTPAVHPCDVLLYPASAWFLRCAGQLMHAAHAPALRSAGADPNARDFDGVSVEDVAGHFPEALALVHVAQASSCCRLPPAV